MAFMNSEYYIGDMDQRLVRTPYGQGLVTKIQPSKHPDSSPPVQEIRLLEWEKAAKASQVTSRRPTILYSTNQYDSITASIGDDVITPYGRGTIAEQVTVRLLNKGKLDPVTKEPIGEQVFTKFHVQINSWKLAGRSRVKCYLFSNQVKVVRKKTLMEMNAAERVQFAMLQKKGASHIFAEKRYQEALNIYAGSIDAVRYIQHDMNNDNECRADLIEVMVTCSNNAATCAIQLQRQEGAFKFAKNSLILLSALFEKRGAKIHTILNKDNGICDAKLFGEWRVKSRLIMASALFEKEGYDLALEELRLAREHIAYYVAGEGASKDDAVDYAAAKASILKMKNQEREIIKLKAKINEKKKEVLQLEKGRAQAMFRDMNPTKDEHAKEEKKADALECPVLEDDAKISDAQIDSKKKVDVSKTLKKRVSFAERLEETREIVEEEEEEETWYDEHREALILLGLGAITAGSFIFARKSMRL